jgi:tetratricopeptide (TPR) repeat protein
MSILQEILRWLRQQLSSQSDGANLAGVAAYKFIYEVHSELVSKNYDKARDLLLQALKHRDKIEDPAIRDGLLQSLEVTWLFADKYEEAISFFSEYTKHYPQDLAATRGHAAALWYSGKFQDAAHKYSHVLELSPNDILSLSGRGQVLAELGDSARAMDDLNHALEAIEAAPHTDAASTIWYEQIEAFVRNGRAVAFIGLGEVTSATREFESSIALCPENAWVYYNRARVYDSARNQEKARLDYQAALAKDRPALNLIQRERAEARLREIQSQS